LSLYNLVGAMKWLLGTYTQRYNRRHRLVGHLFQGRYKCLLIDPEEPEYGRVVSDYIHLNPVRAGMAGDRERPLEGYQWSSYPHYLRPKGKPSWLCVSAVMLWHGWDWAKAADRRRYREYMKMRSAEGEDGGGPAAQEARQKLKRGWVLGSERFRERMEDLASGIIGKHRRSSYEREGASRHDEARAEELLALGLDSLGLKMGEVQCMRQNDLRKQGLAWVVKSRTGMGDAWIMDRLRMGHRSNVSRAVRRFGEDNAKEVIRMKGRLHKCTN
jgi:hypothetical protein